MNQTEKKEDRIRRRAWHFLSKVVAMVFRRGQCFLDPIGVEPPFLLIANHACNSDPIFLGLASKETPLTFVGSEHLERQGFISRILNRYFSVIPRKKATVAVETVKMMKDSLKEGRPVVLFAEGDCSWDGVSARVFPSTGKLAKMMRVPLVTYRLEGNYLSKPRWAASSRKGPVFGRRIAVYDEAALKRMKAEELTDRINQDIYMNVWKDDRLMQQQYKAKAPAEGLEKGFFICPWCHTAGSLQTRKAVVHCTKCDHTLKLSPDGRLSGDPFSDFHQWDVWQKEELADWIQKGETDGLFPGTGEWTDLKKGIKTQVRFELDLKQKALFIEDRPVNFSQIHDMSMVKTNRLLCSCDDGYFELFTKTGILRPYLMAWQISQGGGNA